MGERAPLLARAVGGKVLGPRPGLAIVSFWQGILEIVLRALALVSCVAVIVPGALSTINIDSVKDKNHEETRSLGKAVCAIVIVAGVLGTALELLTIVLRFINIGFINMKIKYFLLADVLLMSGLIFIFIIGGVGTAVSSRQWATVKPHYSYTNIAHSIGAASAISFFCMVIFIVLAAYMLAFIINKWNKKVVVYTLKDAVLG